MQKINILAVQMESAIADKYTNFEKIITLVHKQKKETTANAGVLSLPELWNVGWACDEFRDSAEEID